MRLRLVDRLVLKELLGACGFGLGLFTVLFVSAEIVVGVGRLLLEAGGGTTLLAVYLANRLPQILVLTLPMAVLLGTLLTFGRLSSQRELTALRICGYRFLRVALPALACGLAASGVSLALNQWVVPSTMARANDILFQGVKSSHVLRGLASAPQVLSSGEVLLLCARSLDPRQGEMEGVFLHYFFEGRRRREIYADRARWTGEVWMLENMRWVEFDRNRELGVEMRARQAWTPLPALESPGSPADLARKDPAPDELSPSQLFARAGRLRSRGATAEDERQAARLEVLGHQKLALPLACFVFAGFGVPLGVQPYRTGASTGFGLSLLFILVYYALMTTGLLLAQSAGLAPALGAWLPNLFFVVVAVYLLRERELG